MKGNDIKVGGVYTAKVSGTVQRVRVAAAVERFGPPPDYRARDTWQCVNLATGRAVLVRSAQRFRAEVPPLLNADGHSPACDDHRCVAECRRVRA